MEPTLLAEIGCHSNAPTSRGGRRGPRPSLRVVGCHKANYTERNAGQSVTTNVLDDIEGGYAGIRGIPPANFRASKLFAALRHKLRGRRVGGGGRKRRETLVASRSRHQVTGSIWKWAKG